MAAGLLVFDLGVYRQRLMVFTGAGGGRFGLLPFFDLGLRAAALQVQLDKGLHKEAVPFLGDPLPGPVADPLISSAGDAVDLLGVVVNPEKFLDGVVDVGQGADAFQVGRAVDDPFGRGSAGFEGDAADGVGGEPVHIVDVVELGSVEKLGNGGDIGG